MFLAILNSAFANENAATSAVTRTWYAMARIRLLPGLLAHVHPRFRSPDRAVILQFVVTIVVGIVTGLAFGPVNAFILAATILTAIMIVIYMVFDLASFLYYRRERRHEFDWFLHGLVPFVGIAFLVPIFMASVGVGSSVFRFISPLPYPISLTGPILVAWYIVGLFYLVYLSRSHPDRLVDSRLVFAGEDAAMLPSRRCRSNRPRRSKDRS